MPDLDPGGLTGAPFSTRSASRLRLVDRQLSLIPSQAFNLA